MVDWFHGEWQEPAYQVYSGMLFGLPLSVTSFNRFSRLAEALSRRQCRVLVSLYFDDATITDFKSPRGSGQWAVNQLCAMIGSPFAADKKQMMQDSGTFLCLNHNLADINRTGHVKFWARARFHDKVKEIIYNALAPGKFTRGSFQILRHCQLPRTRYLRPSGLRWPHGH